jgi:hypothetical protein
VTIREGHSYQGDFLAGGRITIGFLRQGGGTRKTTSPYSLRVAQTASVTHPGRF